MRRPPFVQTPSCSISIQVVAHDHTSSEAARADSGEEGAVGRVVTDDVTEDEKPRRRFGGQPTELYIRGVELVHVARPVRVLVAVSRSAAKLIGRINLVN